MQKILDAIIFVTYSSYLPKILSIVIELIVTEVLAPA